MLSEMGVQLKSHMKKQEHGLSWNTEQPITSSKPGILNILFSNQHELKIGEVETCQCMWQVVSKGQ